MLGSPISYGDFFRNAPELNEKRHLIKGVVCGVRVEEVGEPAEVNLRVAKAGAQFETRTPVLQICDIFIRLEIRREM